MTALARHRYAEFPARRSAWFPAVGVLPAFSWFAAAQALVAGFIVMTVLDTTLG